MPARRDYTGQKWGRLTAIEDVGRGPRGGRVWLLRCDCGNEIVAPPASCGTERPEQRRSCGCFQREQARLSRRLHGHTAGYNETRTYGCWMDIRKRCSRTEEQNAEAWRNYGSRGIKVCERWQNSFEAFLEDMGECPGGLSIDRIDNDKGYEPGNCRWATAREQVLNRRNTRMVEWNGETLPLSILCERLNLGYQAAYDRIVREGWPVERAVAALR